MNRVCITGGAGFIGSNLANRLVADGCELVVVDNFRTGRRQFLEDLLPNPRFRLVEGDVLDESLLVEAFKGCDWVFHLQANADVRYGFEHPMLDLRENTIATSTVLEAMRADQVHNIAFSSTGSIYGEPELFPTPENAPFPTQTSLYGASKLAGEGLISAYTHGFGFCAVVCRFVSILGERYTHGHLYDFCKALRENPNELVVLGNGRQEKSYLYVQDCISAMIMAARDREDRAGIDFYNLGTDETIVVDDSIETIIDFLGISPKIRRTGGRRGWIGDSPLIQLDTSRIRSLGWRPQLTIREAILRTLAWFEKNDYIFSTSTESERDS